jgi:hypothetical protein
MSLDDLPLDRPAAPPRPPAPASARPPAWRWLIVTIGAMGAGAVLMFWWMSRTQPVPPAPASPTATDVATVSNRPKRQPLDLPGLDQSDSWIGQLISTLSKHPTLARLLATPGLIRGATLSVVQIGDGRTPAQPLRALRPNERLQFNATTGHLEGTSYSRWDPVAGALTSISSVDAAQLYVNIKPLVDQAYIELGHADGDFDAALVRSIRMLTDTPAPASEMVLLRRPGYYEHDDPALRSLKPVQKQFLLLGPDNRRRVIGWLRQFAAGLDLRLD